MKGRLEQLAQQNIKQIQRLILSPQMQQALHLLQLPIQELSAMIEEELVQNPVLEIEGGNEESEVIDLILHAQKTLRETKVGREEEDLKGFIENTVSYEYSLFEHLMTQARESFSTDKDLKLAEWIIGNLDSNGFLTLPIEEIALLLGESASAIQKIVEVIQTFDPSGVGALNTQEALLIQLKAKGKEESLAFRILKEHFDDVLHNRIPAIAKSLSKTHEEIYRTISEEIVPLELRPGAKEPEGHYKQFAHPLVADLSILYSDGTFSIIIHDEKIPQLRLSHFYLSMLEDDSIPPETKNYITEKIASGKWLLRNLHERHQTLYRIAEELIETQKEYLSEPTGKLHPITMKEIAEKLELHESTIARAVANKYVSCLRGLLPLRSFFTHGFMTEQGENLSADTVKNVLQEIIEKEDKKKPFSDEILSKLMQEKGITCARRTIAKYRAELGIGSTTQRKKH